jgi:hypothetical protein
MDKFVPFEKLSRRKNARFGEEAADPGAQSTGDRRPENPKAFQRDKNEGTGAV